ncbi:MAG: flagellin lysine-N-methylase [Pseudomonadota bacterium]
MTITQEQKYNVRRKKLLDDFMCLGDKCPDTCCKSWSMQFNESHLELYKSKAPELLSAVNQEEMIMKRDPETDYCTKFVNGLCSIHKKYGADYLGDACYLYPKSTRTMGRDITVTATLSCPEITRLALYDHSDPFGDHETEVSRIPESVKDYLPHDMKPENTKIIMDHFIKFAGNNDISTIEILRGIISASRSLAYQDKAKWPEATEFLLKTSQNRVLPAEKHITDPYKLMHSLCGLVGVAKKQNLPNLRRIIDHMLKKLQLNFNWENLTIHNQNENLTAYNEIKDIWDTQARDAIEPVLKRYIQAQLSITHFPFDGFGESLFERACVIGIRYATIRLCLMLHLQADGSLPNKNDIIHLIYNISRFQDHINDSQLSLSIYNDFGWIKEQRMAGLLES